MRPSQQLYQVTLYRYKPWSGEYIIGSWLSFIPLFVYCTHKARIGKPSSQWEGFSYVSCLPNDASVAAAAIYDWVMLLESAYRRPFDDISTVIGGQYRWNGRKTLFYRYIQHNIVMWGEERMPNQLHIGRSASTKETRNRSDACLGSSIGLLGDNSGRFRC